MSLGLLAIDLGKRSFHIHGIDSDGMIISRKTSRSKLIETIKELAPETITMEACASAHFWGRCFLAAGHRVLLINPRFVKPFVKGSKNDAADAEGIYEAAMRPTAGGGNGACLPRVPAQKNGGRPAGEASHEGVGRRGRRSRHSPGCSNRDKHSR
jgi:transposase